MKKRLIIGAATVAAASAYTLWQKSGRYKGEPRPLLFEVASTSHGKDRGAANVVSIAPFMLVHDYASAAHFEAKLQAAFIAAKEAGFFGPKTIVLLPHNIATWLLLSDEKKSVYNAKSFDVAGSHIAAKNIVSIGSTLLRNRNQRRGDAFAHALFASKANQMARDYSEIMSRLSRVFNVCVVGGSIILPAPYTDNGQVMTGEGALYNTSAVFIKGRAQKALSKQQTHTPGEEGLFKGGTTGDIELHDFKGIRFAHLLSRDGFSNEVTRRLYDLKAPLLLSSSSLIGEGAWQSPWQNEGDASVDIDPGDVGSLAQSAAWLRYGVVGRRSQHKAPAVVCAMMQGQIFESAYDGAAHAFSQDGLHVAPALKGTQITNVYL